MPFLSEMICSLIFRDNLYGVKTILGTSHSLIEKNSGRQTDGQNDGRTADGRTNEQTDGNERSIFSCSRGRERSRKRKSRESADGLKVK